MKIQLSHSFNDIVCLDNLLEAWKEFLKGKRNKKDIQEFAWRLMDNILELYHRPSLGAVLEDIKIAFLTVFC